MKFSALAPLIKLCTPTIYLVLQPQYFCSPPSIVWPKMVTDHRATTYKQASDTSKLHLLLPFNLSLFAMHFWRKKYNSSSLSLYPHETGGSALRFLHGHFNYSKSSKWRRIFFVRIVYFLLITIFYTYILTRIDDSHFFFTCTSSEKNLKLKFCHKPTSKYWGDKGSFGVYCVSFNSFSHVCGNCLFTEKIDFICYHLKMFKKNVNFVWVNFHV